MSIYYKKPTSRNRRLETLINGRLIFDFPWTFWRGEEMARLVQGDGAKGKEAIYGWESQVRHEHEEIQGHLNRQWRKEMDAKNKAKAEHSMRAAAKDGDVASVRALIDVGVDVNSIGGQFEQTPLHFAAREGRTEVVQMLINAGANVNARNKDYRTPLHWAAAVSIQSPHSLHLCLIWQPFSRHSAVCAAQPVNVYTSSLTGFWPTN